MYLPPDHCPCHRRDNRMASSHTCSTALMIPCAILIALTLLSLALILTSRFSKRVRQWYARHLVQVDGGFVSYVWRTRGQLVAPCHPTEDYDEFRLGYPEPAGDEFGVSAVAIGDRGAQWRAERTEDKLAVKRAYSALLRLRLAELEREVVVAVEAVVIEVGSRSRDGVGEADGEE